MGNFIKLSTLTVFKNGQKRLSYFETYFLEPPLNLVAFRLNKKYNTIEYNRIQYNTIQYNRFKEEVVTPEQGILFGFSHSRTG